MDHRPDAALILLAGGSGSRMAASMDADDSRHDRQLSGPKLNKKFNKVYLQLGGRDILEYSLATADQCSELTTIVLVIRRGDEDHVADLLERLGLTRPVLVTLGGSTRQESEYAGLCAIRDKIDSGAIGVVAIHDGARPFMTTDLLETTIQVARQTGGAIPGMPLDENLYQIAPDAIQLLPTAELRRVQTPQTFQASALLDAYDQASTVKFQGVDTAETVERFTGLQVRVVPGDHRNIKVTFAEDMFVAEQYAADHGRESR